MRKFLYILFTILLLSSSLTGQDDSIFDSSDLVEEVKIERNIGLSLGYNPFPQEFLVTMEFRAPKRFSPFVGLDIGFEDIRSDPVVARIDSFGRKEYERPEIIRSAAYYELSVGYRVSLAKRTGNYNGPFLDFGLEIKLGGDNLVDYYNFLNRIGYRLFCHGQAIFNCCNTVRFSSSCRSLET